jgi:hypothetical protein
MDITVAGLEAPLRWSSPPAKVGGDVTIDAAARTDIFVDPDSGDVTATAPRALALAPDGDFQFSAHVRVGFAATFDAGVLLVWHDERHSAKLCFERSEKAIPTVVSVVTRGVSDDANAWSVDGDEVWLRISRIGRMWAFHASSDGEAWSMVRAFRLDSDVPAQIGVVAQSPTGEGCTVTFERLTLVERTLADLRDGS